MHGAFWSNSQTRNGWILGVSNFFPQVSKTPVCRRNAVTCDNCSARLSDPTFRSILPNFTVFHWNWCVDNGNCVFEFDYELSGKTWTFAAQLIAVLERAILQILRMASCHPEFCIKAFLRSLLFAFPNCFVILLYVWRLMQVVDNSQAKIYQ